MALPSTTSDPTNLAVDAPADTTTKDVETKTEAVTNDEDTSQTSDSQNADPRTEDSKESEVEAESDDAEIKEWAAKKNLPLDDPIKMAKMVRDTEQKLGTKGHQEGQLKTAVTGANTSAGVDDIQALRNEVTALSFYIAHPEAKALESEMVKILEDKPWLANDLEVVLDVAKGRSSTEAEKLVAATQAGKKEALAQAETAGRAAPPKASASSADFESSSKITAANVDSLIAKNGQKWFVEHRDEINAALATEY